MTRKIWICLIIMLLWSSAVLYAQLKETSSSKVSFFHKANPSIPSTLSQNTSTRSDDVPIELSLAVNSNGSGIISSYRPVASLPVERGTWRLGKTSVQESLLALLPNPPMTPFLGTGGNPTLRTNIITPDNKEQTTGRATISGRIVDAATGDPVPGANVVLEGTAIGASTNLEGRYLITKVPPGHYTLKVTYIGYKTATLKVNLLINRTLTADVKLLYDVLEGETVVITAQAEGQVAAINQQLRSNTIKNIVSAERIMELPDANAAESVGRLPGISIQRSGGEGNRVVIRGLSPTYNTIMIGGIKVPATDLDDRSVNLSMISPEILAGIEVTKALTPDMDADAFGGTVNFTLANAPSGGFR